MDSPRRGSEESNKYSSDERDNESILPKKSENEEVFNDSSQPSSSQGPSTFVPHTTYDDIISNDPSQDCKIGRKAKRWTRKHLAERENIPKLGSMTAIDSEDQACSAMSVAVDIKLLANPLRPKYESTSIVTSSDEDGNILELPLRRRKLKGGLKSSLAGIRMTRRKTVHFGAVESKASEEFSNESPCITSEKNEEIENPLSSADEAQSSGDEGLPAKCQNSVLGEPYSMDSQTSDEYQFDPSDPT